MNSVVTCQDVISVGGQQQQRAFCPAPAARTVDVSMDTVASVWARAAAAGDDTYSRLHEPPLREVQSVFSYGSPPPDPIWTDQLSPHLQRNRQLQDTLVQREEELARLQEENNKLREFLNSSFVKNLEEKAKKLGADGRWRSKRLQTDDGTAQNPSGRRLLLGSPRVSKRVCRNLTPEFCSESERPAASEPNLDLWVLRTLGLKDRDTIDTSNEESPSSAVYAPPPSSSLSEYSIRPSYGAAVTSPDPPPALSSSSSSEYVLHSSVRTSVTATNPPAVYTCLSYCQTSSHPPTYSYNTGGTATNCLDVHIDLPRNCSDPAFSDSVLDTSSSSGPCSNFTATGLAGQYEAVSDSCHPDTAFLSPLSQGVSRTRSPFTQSPEITQFSPVLASSQAQSQEWTSSDRLHQSPLPQRRNQMQTQDTVPQTRGQVSPSSSSSPATGQRWSSMEHCLSPAIPPGGATVSQPHATPETPRCRTDVAFSMSLTPSSSVKTHSFPQGQAFIRKDTQGRWNFTWVPKQGP